MHTDTREQYESLRLNHPLNQLVKTTSTHPQTLLLKNKQHTLPAGTSLHLNLAALHTHPRYWGASGLTWNPARFITSTGPGIIENEFLAPDTSANFIPWAHGQRICPGKKFSQVELVGALARLFRDHVVAPRVRAGETAQSARERMVRTGMDIDHQGTMLFEISRPEGAALVWSRRDD